jgi:hypothetical protein
VEGEGGANDKRTRTEGEGMEKAAVAGRAAVTPFGPLQLSAGAVQLLLGAAVDTWDRVRHGVCRLLAMYPAPLPGTCVTHYLCPSGRKICPSGRKIRRLADRRNATFRVTFCTPVTQACRVPRS